MGIQNRIRSALFAATIMVASIGGGTAIVASNANELLYSAGTHGVSLAVKPLSALGVDNTAKNHALMLAVLNNHTITVDSLLKNGADPNSFSGWPLQHAAQQGRTDIVALLLKHGADAEKLDDLAAQQAEANGHADTAKLLRQHRAPTQHHTGPT